MIVELFHRWGEWNWIILGLVLMLLELAVPGVSLIWLGIAAIVVGFLSLLVSLTWQVQVLIFAILALLCVYAVRRAIVLRQARGDPLMLNKRSERLYGHTYPLSEAIVHGVGRIRVDDSTWGVAGPDLPAGTMVRVTGHDGTLLTVAPL
jgi:inner membrane protein